MKKFFLFFLFFCLGFLLLWYGGYRLTYQATPSMPKGFYFIYSKSTFQKNDIVVFYPPSYIQPFLLEHKWAPNWLMKKVAGVAGDLVCVKNQTVFINGVKIAHVYRFYAPLKLLPHLNFCRRLQGREYFLLSPTIDHSFDSRYFGPVLRENIIGKAVHICL